MIDLRDQQGTVLQQVRIALADVRAAEGHVNALREETEAARTALKIAEERFRDKVGVERDVTVARFDLTRALAHYRAGIYEAYIAQAHLQRSLGLEQLPTEAGRPIQTSEAAQEIRPNPPPTPPARISPATSNVIPSSHVTPSRLPATHPKK